MRAIILFATVAPGIKDILTENLHQVINLRSVWGIISLVTLIWSGKNIFQALAYALNRALGVPQGRSFSTTSSSPSSCSPCSRFCC